MSASPKLKAHLERLHEANRKPESARNRVFHAYKFGAKRRHLELVLSDTLFDQLISQNCYYCEAPPANLMNEEGYGFKYNGIDRRNSKLGYTPDNCVTCCGVCNMMKGELSEEEFLTKVREIMKVVEQRVV